MKLDKWSLGVPPSPVLLVLDPDFFTLTHGKEEARSVTCQSKDANCSQHHHT